VEGVGRDGAKGLVGGLVGKIEMMLPPMDIAGGCRVGGVGKRAIYHRLLYRRRRREDQP